MLREGLQLNDLPTIYSRAGCSPSRTKRWAEWHADPHQKSCNMHTSHQVGCLLQAPTSRADLESMSSARLQQEMAFWIDTHDKKKMALKIAREAQPNVSGALGLLQSSSADAKNRLLDLQAISSYLDKLCIWSGKQAQPPICRSPILAVDMNQLTSAARTLINSGVSSTMSIFSYYRCTHLVSMLIYCHSSPFGDCNSKSSKCRHA